MRIKRIGREYQHPEDLVFTEPRGAMRAQYVLKNIHNVNMSVKWDGNPTIYFGRDGSGRFTLVGKNGWGRDWIGSVDDLIRWTLSSGKQEGWRSRFAEDLAKLWRIIESNFPETETGFYYADVLWHPGKPYEVDGKHLHFTPNKTTYSIDQNSEIADTIIKSSVGLAIHKHYREFHKNAYGYPPQENLFKNSNGIVVMSQTAVKGKISLDSEKIKALDELLDEKHYLPLNQFLFEHRPGLSDFREIIYKYTNSMVKAHNIDLISVENFRDWLTHSSVSFNKQGKIESLLKHNSAQMSLMFDIYHQVMDIKDDLIRQLDENNVAFKSTVNGQPGSEGYVTTRFYIKFVPRRQWVPD